MSSDSLFAMAKNILKNSHSPYSGKKVAAAVQLDNGKTYAGVNIENASYGATVCAERVAIWKALSENPGARIDEIVVCVEGKEAWPPCGMCRQVMAEFASAKLNVHVANSSSVQKTFSFAQLFPESFHGKFLKPGQ